MMRLLAVMVLLTVASPSWAANAPLQQAQKKYKELDYQAMPGLLAEALLQPGLTPPELVEIYRLQGFTYTVLGDATKAREAFIKLLIIEPGHQMEKNVSPRFRGAFEETKKEFEARGAVSLQHTPPVVTGPSEGFEAEWKVHDEFGRVHTASARVRAIVYGKEGGFVDVQLPSTGARTGDRIFRGRLPDPTSTIPGERPTGYTLEYQVSFANPVGAPVAAAGAAPSWKITVGDPNAPPPVAAQGGAAVAQDEPGPGKLPVALAVVGGVAGVGLLGLLTLGAAGVVTGGGGAACYLAGPCNPAPEATYAKVHVVVER